MGAEKMAYYAQNNLDPEQEIMPELKTPNKKFQNQYTIPEFDPKVDQLIFDAKELSKYDKIESFRDSYSINPFLAPTEDTNSTQSQSSVNVHENLSKNPI